MKFDVVDQHEDHSPIKKKKKKLNMKIMDMLSKGFYMLGFLRCDLEGNMMRLICW